MMLRRRNPKLFAAVVCGLAALAVQGCATMPADARVEARAAAMNAAEVEAILAQAADQVRRCYRSPRVSHRAKQIVTRLGIQLNPDGTLAALPAIVAQSGVTPDNSAEAGRMAEAASLAVIRCAPLHLPAEYYGHLWQNFELTFSPRAAV